MALGTVALTNTWCTVVRQPFFCLTWLNFHYNKFALFNYKQNHIRLTAPQLFLLEWYVAKTITFLVFTTFLRVYKVLLIPLSNSMIYNSLYSLSCPLMSKNRPTVTATRTICRTWRLVFKYFIFDKEYLWYVKIFKNHKKWF